MGPGVGMAMSVFFKVLGAMNGMHKMMLNEIFFEIKHSRWKDPSFKIKKMPRSRFFIFFPFFLFGLLFQAPFLKAGEPTGGIGVILEYLPDKKVHRVRAVFQGSPAARAKIQAGEEIVAIDGQATAKMSFEELGKKIRGNPGDPVTLTLRSGDSAPREVRLVRAAQGSVSPLILNAPGSTPGFGTTKSNKPILTEAERNQVKDVIRQLKTPDDQQRMQQLLLDFRDGKVSKEDFFKKLKTDFPSAS